VQIHLIIPNPLPLVFGIEALATALLMAVIYLIVYTKGLRRLGSLAIGAMVGLDIVALLDCNFHWKFYSRFYRPQKVQEG
jgi:glycerol uptake facilitator-like aquaporin